jgi:hypothetical protein
VSPSLEARLKAELRPGEALAWSGVPSRGAFARAGVMPGMLGLAWIAAGIALYDVYLTHAGSDVLEWIGIVLGLAGLAMVSTPLRLWLRAGRIAYGLTDRRAVVLELAGAGAVVASFPLARIAAVVRREEADGSGDLVFSENGGARDPAARARGFLGVAKVREVEERILGR